MPHYRYADPGLPPPPHLPSSQGMARALSLVPPRSLPPAGAQPTGAVPSVPARALGPQPRFQAPAPAHREQQQQR